jgi:hypothetical protein
MPTRRTTIMQGTRAATVYDSGRPPEAGEELRRDGRVDQRTPEATGRVVEAGASVSSYCSGVQSPLRAASTLP